MVDRCLPRQVLLTRPKKEWEADALTRFKGMVRTSFAEEGSFAYLQTFCYCFYHTMFKADSGTFRKPTEQDYHVTCPVGKQRHPFKVIVTEASHKAPPVQTC